jgi:methionyl-tRNA formyltransferase
MKTPFNYTIVTIPDKTLAEPTLKVGSFDDALIDQIEKMTVILKKEGGIGLAANQIGVNNRVLVTEFNDPDNKDSIPFHALVNPEIIEFSPETNCADEGCLSIPPIELPVERSTKIKVKAQNTKGKKIKLTAKGLFARVLQHEIDHLNGKLFTDRVKEKYLVEHPYLRTARIVFIGSGEFASIILKGLLSLNFNIPLVVTETAKPAGRLKELRPSQVAKLAQTFNKKILETDSIKNNISEIAKVKPDLIILSDFGQLIPPEILTIPAIGAFNLHPSLLPKYRGSTPVQTAILEGETETGVSLMLMSKEIDKGPVLAQIKTDIAEDDNSSTLEKRLAVLAMKLLYEALPKLVEFGIKPLEQDDSQVSLTRKFSKEDGLIDWNKPIQVIERQIRAFFPWPGSYTLMDGKRLIIHRAHLEEDRLAFDVVQIEGKNPVSFKAFLKGYRGAKPAWFKKIKE